MKYEPDDEDMLEDDSEPDFYDDGTDQTDDWFYAEDEARQVEEAYSDWYEQRHGGG